MIKNKIFRRFVLLVSLVMLLTSTVNTTFGFIVTKTDSLINTFVPAVGDPDSISLRLTVHKTVHNTGDIIVGPEGFEFVLENTAANEKIISTSNADGKAFFILPFTSEDIGNTYIYRLSETDLNDIGMSYDDRVYEISISIALSEDNELVAYVLIDGQVSEDLVAEFINTYHVDSTDSDPTGDSTHIPFWSCMMVVSGALCIFLIIIDRKYLSK